MDSTFDIELTGEEIDLLLHFAEIGRENVYQRNNLGDRSVAAEVDPILRKLKEIWLASFQE